MGRPTKSDFAKRAARGDFPKTIRKNLAIAALGFSLGAIVDGSSPFREARAEGGGPARIVSIGGSITEILYALGVDTRIVGVDSTSVYPAQALISHPNVGYMRALSAEGILSLKPTQVMAIEGSGPRSALTLVKDAGAPLVWIKDDPSPEGVANKIEAIGEAMGEVDRAQKLARDVRSRFELLGAMRERISKPVRVVFVLSVQNGKPMVAGRGTAASAIIRLAGAVNAADAMEGYKQMTDESLIAAAPDYVVKMTNGDLVGSADAIFALPAFAATPAAARHALVAMDGQYLLGFGPRTPDAAHDLMAALYPDLNLAPLPRSPLP